MRSVLTSHKTVLERTIRGTVLCQIQNSSKTSSSDSSSSGADSTSRPVLVEVTLLELSEELVLELSYDTFRTVLEPALLTVSQRGQN